MKTFAIINELYAKVSELSKVLCINHLQNKSDLVVFVTLICCVEKILDKLISNQVLGIYAVNLQKGVFNYEI